MLNGTGVLVTGAKGFIGSHVCACLEKRGYKPIAFDLADGNDVLSPKLEEVVSREKPKWIVHLAGQVFLKPSFDNPSMDAMTNIVGTINVLETARKHNCGVIFSSSGAVYGNNYQYPEPISPYGISKLTAEKYCELYRHLYGLHMVIFRFSSIYGKGRKATSINLLVTKAMNNETITVFGDGNQTRDFTHVSDVAEAVLLAIEGKMPSGTYDIGTGTATSIKELLRLIEELLGKKPAFTHAPEVVGDPKRNELNVSKAAQFGFKAKVQLIDGLKQLIEEIM